MSLFDSIICSKYNHWVHTKKYRAYRICLKIAERIHMEFREKKTIKIRLNKNVDIKFSVHNTFLE
jgi:phage anti-repressor protein